MNVFELDGDLIERYEQFARSFTDIRSADLKAQIDEIYDSGTFWPEPLIGLDNVMLTPHMAGWSPEATQASVDRFMANAEGHFAGHGVVSPIQF